MKILSISVFVVMALALSASGADEKKSPYIALYEARLQGCHAMVERSRAENKYEQARYERARILYPRNAVSLEEYQEAEARAVASYRNIAMMEAMVAEAEALLAVTRQRIRLGQDMPIHTMPLYPR